MPIRPLWTSSWKEMKPSMCLRAPFEYRIHTQNHKENLKGSSAVCGAL